MTDVDVVIVNWNSGGQLAECLESLGKAGNSFIFRFAKCVVADNASTDGSMQGLGQLPFELDLIWNAKNRGYGAACNQGASRGMGSYVLFLNPDVKLGPDSLGDAVAFMEASPSIGLLGIRLVDEECRVQASIGRFPTPGALLYQMVGLDRLWPRRFRPFAMTDWDHRESREVDVIQGAFLLTRRTAFEQLGGFDERFFMYYEDVDLAYRGRQAGWKGYYFAGAQALHRGGGATEQVKAARLAYWMTGRALYVAKHFGRGAAALIVFASLTAELAARLIWNLFHLSRGHLGETVCAYMEYVKALPATLGA
jgi:N-acetylglucosaminyl-diphospho-decaprenol L-rhamnosyltransferase